MAIDPDRLLSLAFPEVRQEYSARDCMLYALGLGLGGDPTDPDDLRFVYERDLEVLPTMACVIGHPGHWTRDLDTGIDHLKVVHGEQGLTLHQPLPSAAATVSRSRVTGIIDKGAGRGALVYWERILSDEATGEPLATLRHTTFCRGDGGFGGPSDRAPALQGVPCRAPDHVDRHSTPPQLALIYRLSGDMNPLHADPATAGAGGFERPILQGLAIFAIAGRAVVRYACGGDPTRLISIDARFTAPAFPGETFVTEVWLDSGICSFRTTVAERQTVVLDHGVARYSAFP